MRLDLSGLDYNPSVAVGDTSLCTREAALRVAWESLFRLFCNKLQKIHLLLSRRRQTPLSATQTSPLTGESPLGRLIASAEGGGGIPPSRQSRDTPFDKGGFFIKGKADYLGGKQIIIPH